MDFESRNLVFKSDQHNNEQISGIIKKPYVIIITKKKFDQK